MVETLFFKLSRLRVSIEACLRIRTLQQKPCQNLSRRYFYNCQEFHKHWDAVFITVNNFSMVETLFFKCQYWESWSWPLRDKLRPPSLVMVLFIGKIKIQVLVRNAARKPRKILTLRVMSFCLIHTYCI